ncbi:hypothetical protein [Novosphingobium colocasiae]|uniref:hypothetical protein n=1 Tax=Novosphingobium colocasiae TaxID=1256513 RepID=UPI0035B10E7F
MTVAARVPSADFLEDGVSTAFPLAFRFLDPTHIKASRTLADGSEIPLAYGIDYSASGGGTDAGGTLTTTAAAAAPVVLHAWRETPQSQGADYITADRFPAESHEQALDRATLILQELQVGLNRGLLVARGKVPLAVGNVGLGQVLGNVNGEIVGVENSPVAAEDAAVRAELARGAAVVARAGSEAGQAGSEDARDAAELAQAGAESARDDALAFGLAQTWNTYADAAARVGWADGDRAIVIATDTGTHASATGDYGASGGQTPNSGYYTYSTSLTKLVRKGALESALTGANADRAEAAAVVAVPLVDGFDNRALLETYEHGVTAVDGSSGPISPTIIWLNNPVPRTGKVMSIKGWAKSTGATEVHFHRQDANGDRIFAGKVTFIVGAIGAGEWDVSGLNFIAERGWFVAWAAGARVAVATAPASLYSPVSPIDGTPITPAYISNYPAFSIVIDRNTKASEGAVKDAIDTIPLMPPAGISFLSPSNTVRTRAAITAARKGIVLPLEQRLILAAPADSNTAGAMVGEDGAYKKSSIRNWFFKLAAQLPKLIGDDGLNIRTDYNSFLGANNPQPVNNPPVATPNYNPNFLSMGGWTFDGSTALLSLGGAQYVSTTPAGGDMVVAIADGMSEAELGLISSGALGLGILQYSVDDGGTWASFDQSGAAGYTKVTVPLPAGTGRTIRFRHYSGAKVAVHRMFVYRTDTPSLVFANGAIPGSRASTTWTTFASPWSPLTLLRNQAAAAKFIMIGSNDIDDGVSLDTYSLWLRREIYAALAKSDVFVITPPPIRDDGQPQHSLARQASFVAAAYDLCRELNVPFINTAARLGNWDQANAAGFMGALPNGYIHVNYYGDDINFYMAFDMFARLG